MALSISWIGWVEQREYLLYNPGDGETRSSHAAIHQQSDSCLGVDSSKHLAEIGGGSFLIGEFEDSNGVPYVLIVNKNIHISSAFHVKFKEPGTVMMTSPYTDQTYGFGGENGWLSRGSGILLSLGK